MLTFLIILSTLFADANSEYAAGNYAEAAELYEQALSQTPAAEVYYNLGNARFKQGELAQAILAYERCLRLNPRMKDARHNLLFAQSRIQDNIHDNDNFFLRKWYLAIRNSLSLSAWATISVVCFLLFLTGILLFALSREIAIRKTAFYLSLVMLLVAVLSFTHAWGLHQRDTLREEAIITQGIVNAKSSPDRSGTDLFTLHEGTKVRVRETLGEWCRIHVGNYDGWILLANLERI